MTKVRLCAYVPKELAKKIDELISNGVFVNKSDAITVIIYDYVRRELRDNNEDANADRRSRHIVV